MTVNVIELPDGLVAIKSYSENEGLLEQLISLGLVTEVVSYVSSGFASIPICKIDQEILDQYSIKDYY